MQSHFLVFILLANFEENHNLSKKNDHLPAWRKIGNIHFTISTGPIQSHYIEVPW